MMNYDPIKHFTDKIKDNRIEFESDNSLAMQLLKIIGHILFHFPFYKTWDDIEFTSQLLNWNKKGSIDKFFTKYNSSTIMKFRYWEQDKKRMTYIDINFPKNYNQNSNIFLKNIMTEQDCIPFVVIIMRDYFNKYAIYEKTSQ
jgi:hypothetical protein